MEDVKLAPARWIDWLNSRGLYKYGRDLAPVELEVVCRSTPETSRRLRSQIRKSPDSPGRFKRPSFGCGPTMRKATVYGE